MEYLKICVPTAENTDVPPVSAGDVSQKLSTVIGPTGGMSFPFEPKGKWLPIEFSNFRIEGDNVLTVAGDTVVGTISFIRERFEAMFPKDNVRVQGVPQL